MTVKWCPVRAENIVIYTQPSPDVLVVNGVEYDMSDPEVVEFAIPDEARQYILDAHRVDGVLHVTLWRPYGDEEKGAWETAPYRGIEYESYGSAEVLV